MLDHPPLRTMTAGYCDALACADKPSRSRRMICARFAFIFSPFRNQRAQGMPDARCTRGLVCKRCAKKRTRAYRFSGGNPAFPARWLYGLCRALPGDEFVLSPSSANDRHVRARLGRHAFRELDTSNGCQDHTVLPYAAIAGRLRVDRSLTDLTRPAIPSHTRRCRVHRIPPQRS